jgi:site-specific recombinase XerD
MRNEKGLAEATINNSCGILKRFFSSIKEDHANFLSHLTPGHLDRLLIQKLDKGIYARKTIHTFAITLRTFLRYAEYRGWCPLGIADSIHAPRVYSQQSLPSSPSWEDVQRLLKTTEGNSPSDIRARAIILLLTVYGLRDSEIRNLRLEDIDWEQETFRLKHSKHGPTQQFPLAQTVGQALVHYIKKARPRGSKHREIFLTISAPFRPCGQLYTIVKTRWKPLNVAIEHHGPHSLRHACATRLINQGMSLKTIADQLGHRNLDTTSIYAKVDLTKIREVANFHMGGLS